MDKGQTVLTVVALFLAFVGPPSYRRFSMNPSHVTVVTLSQ
jgi:hypothetical protein